MHCELSVILWPAIVSCSLGSLREWLHGVSFRRGSGSFVALACSFNDSQISWMWRGPTASSPLVLS